MYLLLLPLSLHKRRRAPHSRLLRPSLPLALPPSLLFARRVPVNGGRGRGGLEHYFLDQRAAAAAAAAATRRGGGTGGL